MTTLAFPSKHCHQFKNLSGFVAALLMLATTTSCQPHSATTKATDRSDSSLSVLESAPSASPTPQNSTAAIESRKVLHVNAGALGTYQGNIDNQSFKLKIESVTGDNIGGWIAINEVKRRTSGKITQLGNEPVPGGKVILYRLILSETGMGQQRGEYVITLSIGSNGTTGDGSWLSDNKKQNRLIEIKERVE